MKSKKNLKSKNKKTFNPGRWTDQKKLTPKAERYLSRIDNYCDDIPAYGPVAELVRGVTRHYGNEGTAVAKELALKLADDIWGLDNLPYMLKDQLLSNELATKILGEYLDLMLQKFERLRIFFCEDEDTAKHYGAIEAHSDGCIYLTQKRVGMDIGSFLLYYGRVPHRVMEEYIGAPAKMHGAIYAHIIKLFQEFAKDENENEKRYGHDTNLFISGKANVYLQEGNVFQFIL